jgi:hypothetical protein
MVPAIKAVGLVATLAAAGAMGWIMVAAGRKRRSQREHTTRFLALLALSLCGLGLVSAAWLVLSLSLIGRPC